MAYFVLDNFAKGVDRRRPEVGALPGSLYVGQDVHITSGGTAQKRKAFVSKYTLPTGLTKGLAKAGSQLYVFGHADAAVVNPDMPAGVTYQRLQHPSGEALTKVHSFDVFNGKVYAAGEFTDGSIYQFYDGTRVTDLADGRARGFFFVTGGSSGAGNKVSSIKVNGVEALGADVLWTTSHEATATAIAAQINSYSSTPNYTAAAVNGAVFIIHPTAGDDYNGLAVAVTVAGDVTVSTPNALQGGVDGALETGEFVKTYKLKMYTTASSLVLFSGINQPTSFTNGATGAGAVNLSNHAAGSEQLIAIGEYLDMLAFFGEGAVQLWSVDADPEQNVLVQVLPEVDLEAKRSVTPFGGSDLFFLSGSGVRALRPSDTAAGKHETVAVSEQIDPLLREQMLSLTASQREDSLSLREPRENRFWQIVDDTIYVFSYFPSSSVAAWSTYKPGFVISDAVILNRKVYVRSGNIIYVYGGDDDLTYDVTQPIVRVPNIIAQAPATFKGFTGFDIGCVGEWTVESTGDIGGSTLTTQGVVTQATYPGPDFDFVEETSHLTLVLTGAAKAEAAEIVNIGLHFQRHEAN